MLYFTPSDFYDSFPFKKDDNAELQESLNEQEECYYDYRI